MHRIRSDAKTILVTGCSSGIGEVAAKALAKRGYRVFATARRHEDVARLQTEGLEALRLDLDDSASIHQAVDEVLDRTGGTLFALFNNGAFGQPGAVEDLTRQTLRAQFETNLFGWHELTCRLIPVMRTQGEGRIVQNSSVLGLVAMSYRGAYNASKFALEGLTDTLRLELKGTGIAISLIDPGPIATRFRENAYRKWKENVDSEHSVHRARYRAMETRLLKEGPAAAFTLPPEAVVEKLIHALESSRPRSRYYVTFPAHLFGRLRHWLPTGAMDWILAHAAGG